MVLRGDNAAHHFVTCDLTSYYMQQVEKNNKLFMT